MKNTLIIAFIILVIAGCAEPGKQVTPPNIIFIMSDDHAYQAIGAYGHPISKLAPTPNIDRIAQEGMMFHNMFVANSICGPSRATIITGKFSHKNGFRNNGDLFDANQPTLPKYLQEAGYQTAVVGKWHLKSTPQGFDYWCVLPGQGRYYNPDFLTENDTIQIEGYVTDIITDLAIEWLDQKRDQSKPFLLLYQHKAPHREWLPPEEYLDYYHNVTFPEPPNLFDTHENMGTAARDAEMLISEHMALSMDNKIQPEILEEKEFKPFLNWYHSNYYENLDRMNSSQRESWENIYGPINEAFRENTPEEDELTRWKYQRYLQDYLGCIKSVDDNVGRILDYLRENGLEENTIVVYTSDQGFYLGEHGWFDKRFMYEESFQTPLLVKYPVIIPAGTTTDKFAQNIDFAPTFLELANVEIPKDMQGVSLVPVLKGEEPEEWRTSLYYHYYEFPSIHMAKRHYGIRTERYKLIHFYNDIDEWELYDLRNDPSEMHNLIDHPDYQEIKNDLHRQLDSLMMLYDEPPIEAWRDE